MTNKKQKWRAPKLIVITRDRPDESVLQTCKAAGSGSGLNGLNSACYSERTCLMSCDALSDS